MYYLKVEFESHLKFYTPNINTKVVIAAWAD